MANKTAPAPRKRRPNMSPALKAKIIERLRIWKANRPKVIARELNVHVGSVHVLKYQDRGDAR